MPKTVDERIDQLTTSQEKTQIMLAEIVDTLKRLERIAYPTNCGRKTRRTR